VTADTDDPRITAFQEMTAGGEDPRMVAFSSELAALLEFRRIPNTEAGHAELASVILDLADRHFPSPRLRCRVMRPEVVTAEDEERRAWPMELYWEEDDNAD